MSSLELFFGWNRIHNGAMNSAMTNRREKQNLAFYKTYLRQHLRYHSVDNAGRSLMYWQVLFIILLVTKLHMASLLLTTDHK